MKYSLTLITILCFSISCSFGQINCRSLDSIVLNIKNANYLKNSKINTGLSSLTYSESIDSQYLRFEELKHCASIDDLKNLMNNENNVVLAYSWKAYLIKNPSDAFEFLSLNSEWLCKKEVVEFLNHCQGKVSKSLDVYMIYELYDRLLSKEIKLTSNEMVDFLIFKEEWLKKRPISEKGF